MGYSLNYSTNLVIDEVAVHLDHFVVLVGLDPRLDLQELVPLEPDQLGSHHLLVELEQVAQVVLSHARVSHLK